MYVDEAGKSRPDMAARLVKAITAAARSAKDATPVLASGRSVDRATAEPCAGVVAAGASLTAANVPVSGAPPAPTDAADAPSEPRPASALATSFDAPSCGSAALGPHCRFVDGDAGAGTAATSSRRTAGQVAEPGVPPVASDVAATADGEVAAAGDAVAAVGLAVCGDPDDAPLAVVSDGGGLHVWKTERAATGCRDEAVDCGELSLLRTCPTRPTRPGDRRPPPPCRPDRRIPDRVADTCSPSTPPLRSAMRLRKPHALHRV